ncbi:MAG TPA: XRE family transcriptional regulator [Verrucomicrobiae bacterium]|nr:XRE family transcriptional regulator [Verrucomicrobiae bacterium]
MTTSVAAAPYLAYGKLIHAWRNEIKHTFDMVSQGTGIAVDRLKALEKGALKPEWPELEALAKYLRVGVRDLLPFENDLDRGCKFLRNKESTKFDQQRAGRTQYTYWNRVMSSALPAIKPVELLLHLNRREDVVMNRGHFFHQYTQVLHGGPVAFLWEWEGTVHEEVFTTGDSWLIPGFVPHAFYSPDAANPGRILALTMGQHLTGDAAQELSLLGKDNVGRIVHDAADYYPKGSANPQ